MMQDYSGRYKMRTLMRLGLPLLLPLLLSACQSLKNADFCETSAFITWDVVVGVFAAIAATAFVIILVALSSPH
jgi:hypothetical protein